MTSTPAQFQLTIPVTDLGLARGFYGGVLGCSEGRSSDRFVDFDFYGHQLVAHLVPRQVLPQAPHRSTFDGHPLLVPHFGLNLDWTAWRRLTARLLAAEVRFVQEPHVRLEGQVGEHHSVWILDPFGNAIEFRRFTNPTEVFARADARPEE